MAEIIDPETGEIMRTEDVDTILAFIKKTQETINNLKGVLDAAKQLLIGMASFTSSNTARIEGIRHKCKIELPSKIKWDQQQLIHVLWKYPYMGENVIKIANYKVDMREYKKIMNTTKNYDSAFSAFKKDLMAASVGIEGKVRITFE